MDNPTNDQVREWALHSLLNQLINGATTKDRVEAIRELEKRGYDLSKLSDSQSPLTSASAPAG